MGTLLISKIREEYPDRSATRPPCTRTHCALSLVEPILGVATKF